MEKTKRKVTRVFQVIHEIVREEDGERIIYEKEGDKWYYHAPNAQDHSEEQIEVILKKLKELNKEEQEKGK